MSFKSRYACQEKLFSKEGQNKLSKAKVCIIGVGALGSNTAELLCRAGIGHIRIVDFDIIDTKNLHRQTLYTEADIGNFKVLTAEKALTKINSSIKVEAFNKTLTESNANELLSDFLVLDCSDNLQTRRIINSHATVWIHAAVVKSIGTVMVLTKKDLFNKIFDGKVSPESCSADGILPTLPAQVSAIQSTECIKLILGEETEKRIIRLNGLSHVIEFFNI